MKKKIDGIVYDVELRNDGGFTLHRKATTAEFWKGYMWTLMNKYGQNALVREVILIENNA